MTIVEAICLFSFFLNLQPMRKRRGNIVNYVAKHSFSVYIIHFSMMSELFTKVFHVQNWINNIGTGILAILISSIVIYVVCTIIDVFKYSIFDKVGKGIEQWKIKQMYLAFCEKWDLLMNDL